MIVVRSWTASSRSYSNDAQRSALRSKLAGTPDTHLRVTESDPFAFELKTCVELSRRNYPTALVSHTPNLIECGEAKARIEIV